MRLRRRGRRRAPGRATRASRCTAPATARSLLGPGRGRRLGAVPRRDGRRRSLENGGRSCVNASGVWATAHARRDRGGAGASAWPRSRPRAAEDDPRPSSRRSPTPRVAAAHLGDRSTTAWREPGARRPDGAAPRGRPARRPATARPTCCRRSSSATRPTIRWPTASSCSRSRAWCRCGPRRCPSVLGPTLALTAITDDAALCGAACWPRRSCTA